MTKYYVTFNFRAAESRVPRPIQNLVSYGPCPELLFLKALRCKSQRPAVLGHRPHNVIWRPIRNFRGYLERNGHGCANQARKMRDDFLGNPARIPSDTRGVKSCGAVIAR